MGRPKTQPGEVNKSAAIREIFAQKPDAKVAEVIALLAEKGIKASTNLVYLVKGTISGGKKRRRRIRNAAAQVVAASGQDGATSQNGTSGHVTAPRKDDVLKTILKVKAFAAEVGGLRTLKGLVDALSE